MDKEDKEEYCKLLKSHSDYSFEELVSKKTNEPYKYYLSIFAYFRDEARFLKEWIEFHRQVGVEHFYLLNNWSEDNWQEVLRPYIDEGIVDVVVWNSKYSKSYKEAGSDSKHMRIKRFAFNNMDMINETQWLAMIDGDEFLFPTSKQESLKDILKEFEDFGGIGVRRYFFGSSGHIESPSGLVIANYTFRAKEFGIMLKPKSIVNMDYFLCPLCNAAAHLNSYSNGRFTMDTEKNRYFHKKPALKRIRINHYFTKSKNDWEDRMNRSNKKYISLGGKNKSWKHFHKCDSHIVKDTTILRYVKHLAKRLYEE